MPVPSLRLRAPLDGGVQRGPGARGGLQAPSPGPSNAPGAVSDAPLSQTGPDVQPSTSRPAQLQTPNVQQGVTGPSKGAKGVPGRSNLAAPGDGSDAGQAGDGPPPPGNSGEPAGNDGPGSGGDVGSSTDGSPPPPTSQPPPPVSTSASRSSTSKPTSTQTRPTKTTPTTSLPPPTPNAPNTGGGGSSGPPQANPGSPPPSSNQSPPPPASSSLQPAGKGDMSHGSTNVSDKPQSDPVYAQQHDDGGKDAAEKDNNDTHSGDDNGSNSSGSGGDYHHADPAASGSTGDPSWSGSTGAPSDPSTGLPGNANTDHKHGGLPAAGVAVLVIALVLVVAGMIFFLRRRQKRHGKPAPQFVFVGQSHYQDLDEGEEKLSPLPERGLSAKLRSSVRRSRAPRWSGYSNGTLHIPRSSAEIAEGSFVIGDAASDRSSRISEASASSFTPTVSTGVQFAAPSPPPTARPLKFCEDDPFADPCNPFMDPYCTRAPSPKLSL